MYKALIISFFAVILFFANHSYAQEVVPVAADSTVEEYAGLSALIKQLNVAIDTNDEELISNISAEIAEICGEDEECYNSVGAAEGTQLATIIDSIILSKVAPAAGGTTTVLPVAPATGGGLENPAQVSPT